MALGATSGEVCRHVLGGTFRLVLVGIVLGMLATIPMARALATLLFETSPLDPATFASTALLLAFVAFAAGYIPARRASRLNPVEVLRAG